MDRLTVLGIAAAIVVPALLIFPKASSFRGDLHDKWHQRATLCGAALAERAYRRIRILRDEATRLIGEAGAPFDPSLAVGDPQQLVRYVTEFQDAIRLRANLDRWLKSMIKTAGIAPIAVGLYVIGTSIGTTYYANWWEWPPALVIACGCAGGGVLLAVVVIAAHFYFDRRLTSAEIIANEPDEL
ncbi:hypothetical protein GCM10027535_55630 [Mycolicibacterium hippocampi]